MKTKHIILIGAAFLVVLIVLAGILLADEFKSDPTYATRLADAKKYFEAGDYDNAILEYKAAIDMPDADEEAYIGLASLYVDRDYMELARQTLMAGSLRFGEDNVQIRNMLTTYFPESLAQDDGSREIPQESEDKPAAPSRPILNVELLQYLSGATFGDYQSRYPNLQTTFEGGKCTATAVDLPVEAVFYNTGTAQVINAGTGRPYPEYLPNEIRFIHTEQIFGGADTIEYTTLQTISGITNLSRKDGCVSFEACGCRLEISCDENGRILPGAGNVVYPLGMSVQGNHFFKGRVIDAATGGAVSGAKIKFYAGPGAYGTPYEVTSDSSGNYEIGVKESGAFTAVVSKTGYIEETFSLFIPDAVKEMKNDFTISSQLNADEIRIVLTWGASPSDLDSYLTGTAADGSRVRINYMNQQARNSSGAVVAELDVDKMSGYGPETVTIHDVDGVYEYSVVDYTRTSGVGTSGATVKIYQGNQLVQTLTPAAGIGLGWQVCKIDHGVITVINGTCGVNSDGLLAGW